MKTILVTGGAGYIGNVICNLALEQGYKVKAVDLLWFKKDIPLIHMANPNYEFIRGDVRNVDLVDQLLEGVNFIVHTAAVVGEPASKKFPELTSEINYGASINLIEKASQKGIDGFFFFSTCSNYGVVEGLATEESLLKPLSLYSETKVNVERYLMDETKNIDWVIGRLSTVYGLSPRMRFDLTVNEFAKEGYLKNYLDVFLPHTYRPYIHVFDLARTVLEMVNQYDHVKNNVFNVGFEGQNYKKIQIVEAVQKFIPDLKVDLTDKGQDLRDYQVSFDKLKRYLNLKNLYTIEDGVKEVIDVLKMGLIKDTDQPVFHNNFPDLGEKIEARAGCA